MPQSPGAIRATVLVFLAAVSTFAVGVLILFGGPVRFSSPSFETARALAPWWAWGLAMVVSGALAGSGAFAHFMWLARIGHSMSSVVYLFLVITLLYSALHYPAGALTGVGIYSGFALIHAWAAATADLEVTTRHANQVSRESRQRFDDAMRED